MSGQKTIALVANTTWNIYNFRLNIIDKLLKEGHKVVVLSPIDEYLKYKEKYPTVKHFGIRTLNRYGVNPLSDVLLILELIRKYRKIKPDIILHYTNKPNIYGALAAKVSGIDSIATITGLGYAFIHRGTVSKITKLLYRIAAKMHKKLIFQNKADRKLFIENNFVEKENALLVKGSGVDTQYFFPSENGVDYDHTTFTFIGRLLYDKGIVEFIDAAKSIKKKYPKARFWVVGELDEKNPSSIEKEDLNYWIDQKIIEYRGFERDVRPVLRKTDCVVLPSYREGLPRIVLEGLAMGKPIITTKTAGCEETVNDGQNGFLVAIKSSKELITAIEQFLNKNIDEQKEMGKAGRLRAEKEFDSLLIADQVYDIIKPIINIS